MLFASVVLYNAVNAHHELSLLLTIASLKIHNRRLVHAPLITTVLFYSLCHAFIVFDLHDPTVGYCKKIRDLYLDRCVARVCCNCKSARGWMMAAP